MNKKIYPSDMNDAEWACIQALIPAAKRGGRPRTLCMRAVLKAILYVTKGGIPWRRLPSNFPKWQSVYHDLRAWKRAGVWVRIHETFRTRVRLVLESVTRAEGQQGFAVLPHRWVVERTLAWLNQNRRLSKDYEALPSTSEAFVYVAMTRLMLTRLAV